MGSRTFATLSGTYERDDASNALIYTSPSFAAGLGANGRFNLYFRSSAAGLGDPLAHNAARGNISVFEFARCSTLSPLLKFTPLPLLGQGGIGPTARLTSPSKWANTWTTDSPGASALASNWSGLADTPIASAIHSTYAGTTCTTSIWYRQPFHPIFAVDSGEQNFGHFRKSHRSFHDFYASVVVSNRLQENFASPPHQNPNLRNRARKRLHWLNPPFQDEPPVIERSTSTTIYRTDPVTCDLQKDARTGSRHGC
ncbi:hypothetical protein R3P38DRAFT_3214164 [Favolaschia claudopus]|uniref:Uncharacterized protein n=1 Tax=Favolaschia claudopus TaxID=2862362 RepID=A0AAW0AAD7_9AGAR